MKTHTLLESDADLKSQIKDNLNLSKGELKCFKKVTKQIQNQLNSSKSLQKFTLQRVAIINILHENSRNTKTN